MFSITNEPQRLLAAVGNMHGNGSAARYNADADAAAATTGIVDPASDEIPTLTATHFAGSSAAIRSTDVTTTS